VYKIPVQIHFSFLQMHFSDCISIFLLANVFFLIKGLFPVLAYPCQLR
jgi:hypothetical protein